MRFAGSKLLPGYQAQLPSEVIQIERPMKIFSRDVQFADLYSRQAAGDDNVGIRIQPLRPSDALPAPGRCCVCYAAGIDHDDIGSAGRVGPAKSELFEKLSNLLTFVLVDLAAKSIYGKSCHDVI